MDWGKAFAYAFLDKRWPNKLLLAALISIVPILSFAWTGYSLEVIRNVAADREPPLPEWGDNFGDKFVQGLLMAVILFLYALPVVALMGVIGLGFALLIPLFATTSGQDSSVPAIAGVLIGILAFLVILLMGLYLLAFALATPAITIRFAATRRFGAAFEFKEIWRFITERTGDYFLMVLIVFGVGVGLIMGAGFINFVIGLPGFVPFIGICYSVLTLPLTMMIYGAVSVYAILLASHLYGQYVRLTTKPS